MVIAMNKQEEFIELLTTFSTTEIVIIKSILDNAEIKYYFTGKPLGEIFPTHNKPVRLMVEKSKIEIARELLGKIK